MSNSIRLLIHRPDGHTASYEIPPGVYTIGRDEDCRIRLPHRDVAQRHAVLIVRGDELWIEDLGDESGTRVDGVPTTGRAVVTTGQRIAIGPFVLEIAALQPEPEPAGSVPALCETEPAMEPSPAPNVPFDADQKRAIKQQIHRELLARLDIKRLSVSRIDKQDLQDRAHKTILDIVAEVRDRLPADLPPEALAKEVYHEAVGLGPIEDLLADADITEIMVNGPSRVYIEREGKLVRTSLSFTDDSSVLAIIERIVSPLGRRIDESQPYVDARLPDGSRVNAIIHPLSLVGPCLTIRKFSKTPFKDEDLIRFGSLSASMANFARLCVVMRKNIVVSGGTGSGKTTLLNVLSSYLPPDERIITIEDAAELRLTQEHVVRLEARPPNIEGRGAVTIRDLVRNALRMRPDRIVVGECRGGEALDMLQAMNTGHDGSLTTVHANSPRDVISRLETMVLMSGMDLPVRAIREQLAAAIDLIIHVARCSDGSRKISQITEVVGQEGDQVTMQDIFEFRQTGVGDDGRVLGQFAPTGSVPTFVEEISSKGLSIDRRIFDPQSQEDAQ